MGDNKIVIQSRTTYSQIRNTLISAQTKVKAAVNSAMVQAYWEIGSGYTLLVEKMTERSMVRA